MQNVKVMITAFKVEVDLGSQRFYRDDTWEGSRL